MDDGLGGLDGGRIDIKVVADLSDINEARLQKDIDRRTKAVKAKLQAEIDARRVAATADAAARAAERQAEVRLRATVDRSQLRRDLDGVSRSDVRIRFTAEVDEGQLRADVDDAARAAAATVEVGADADPAREEADRFRRDQRDRPVTLPFKIDMPDLSKVADVTAKLATIPTIAAGIGFLVASVGQLGAGLFGLVSAAGQAAGALAVLPAAAGAAVQGLAGLFVGLKGVGTALGALSQADQQSGASAGAAAAAREAAAQRVEQAAERIKQAERQVRNSREAVIDSNRAVRDAEERVAEAVKGVQTARENAGRVAESVADAAERSARRVADAERSYAAAVKASQAAQEGLNEARKAAKERLEDLALAVKGGALDEESAQIGIERAKERLQKVMKDPFASDLDKREADLAYRQALQRLEEVKERNGDLREEKADADARGVEGSKEVQAAQERLAAAQERILDSERAIADARKAAAREAEEGARRIAAADEAIIDAKRRVRDAEEALERARRSQRNARESAADARLALEKAKKEQEAAKKAAAAPTGGGGGRDPVAEALAKLTPSMRAFVLFLHNTVRPELTRIREATQEALAPGLQAGVQAAMPLLATLRGNLAITGSALGGIAKEWGEFFGGKSFNADLTQIMGRNNQALALFGKAGTSAFKGLTDVFVVLSPFVVKFADMTAKAAQRFAELMSANRADGSMEDWFERAWEAASKLWRLLKNLTLGLMSLGKAAAPSGNTMMEDLAQGAERFARWAADPATQAKAQRFFDSLVPVMRELGGLFKDLGGLAKDLTLNLDPATLAGTLGVLRSVVEVLRDVAGSDVGGAILSVVGPLGALLAVVAKFGGLGAAVKLMGLALKAPGAAVKAGVAAGDFLGGLGGKGRDTKAGKAGQAVGQGAKTAGGAAAKAGNALKDAVTSMVQSNALDVFAGSLATKVKTAFGKLKPSTLFSKINPADLVGKVKTKINPASWFSKINPAELLSSAGGAAAKAGSTVAGKVGNAASALGSAAAAGAGKGVDLAKAGAAKVGQYGKAAATAALDVGKLALAYGAVALQASGAAIKQGVMAIATGAVRAATAAWTAVQWLLNAALNANPIALVVLAIAALVAGVLYAYNNIEWFRTAVDTAWRAISTAFQVAWNNVIKPALTALWGFLKNTLWPAVQGFWTTVVQPTWNNISAAIRTAWEGVIKPALSALWGFLKNNLWPTLQALWTAVVKPSWENISGAIRTAWEKLIKPALSALWTFVTKTLPDGFKAGVAAIGKIWEGLSAVAKVPIKFVVETIYNKGIAAAWNWLADRVGLGRLPTVNLGFARGGIVPGGSYGVLPGYAPGRDTMLAAVSPGEAWLRPEAARWLGSGWINAVNSAARRGSLPRFAGGGVAKKGDGDSWADWFKKGAAYLAERVLTPLKTAARAGAGTKTGWQQMIGAFPGALIDGVIGWFRGGGAGGNNPPRKAYARGGLVTAEGYGVLPGYAPGRDTMLAAVSPGEAWLRPEAARWLGTEWINAVNDAARRGRLTRFAGGGVVGASSAELYQTSRSAARPRPTVSRENSGGGGSATVNVYPQPGQDEYTIGTTAARRLGALIR
ncbi:hypothetical protein GCM10027187_40740 [Streptosporangium sandarakinum]|uniref:Tape measure protein n=1 Tax=Streptosporangium sandarakinum TaxID=1260955 RepID=A0A852VEH0_9ACTN|nr:hypothetical protein [Streptosporangium sandarakinum]NYF44595.1 hypothetical protein [Streptosporangium sandarakinum]